MKTAKTELTKLWVVLSVCACVFALAPHPAHADDKSHRAAIIELFTAMDMKTMMSSSIDAMLKAQLAANPAFEAVAPKLRAFFEKYMSWASLQDDFVKMYAKTFSEAEVKQLIAFYKTPIGKKSVQELPRLAQEGAQLGAARMQQHMPELMQMMKEEATK